MLEAFIPYITAPEHTLVENLPLIGPLKLQLFGPLVAVGVIVGWYRCLKYARIKDLDEPTLVEQMIGRRLSTPSGKLPSLAAENGTHHAHAGGVALVEGRAQLAHLPLVAAGAVLGLAQGRLALAQPLGQLVGAGRQLPGLAGRLLGAALGVVQGGPGALQVLLRGVRLGPQPLGLLVDGRAQALELAAQAVALAREAQPEIGRAHV